MQMRMLCLFSKYGNERKVKILLSLGVDPNCHLNCQSTFGITETPLHNALYGWHRAWLVGGIGPSIDHINVVKLLLDAGATPWPSEIHLMQEYYKIMGQTKIM